MIVCAQLAAFGKVSGCREAGKEKERLRKKERTQGKRDTRKGNRKVVYMSGSGQYHQNGDRFGTNPQLFRLEAASNEDSAKSSDSEIIL